MRHPEDKGLPNPSKAIRDYLIEIFEPYGIRQSSVYPDGNSVFVDVRQPTKLDMDFDNDSEPDETVWFLFARVRFSWTKNTFNFQMKIYEEMLDNTDYFKTIIDNLKPLEGIEDRIVAAMVKEGKERSAEDEIETDKEKSQS